jgi:hypothetical protein
MGLFDGCRCRRLDLHGSKQRVYVVRASSETSAWRSCFWPRIAKLRAILHWPPLAFLIKKPEIRNGYTSHVTGLVPTARIPFSGLARPTLRGALLGLEIRTSQDTLPVGVCRFARTLHIALSGAFLALRASDCNGWPRRWVPREDGAIGTQEEPAGFGSGLFSLELDFGPAPLGAACL